MKYFSLLFFPLRFCNFIKFQEIDVSITLFCTHAYTHTQSSILNGWNNIYEAQSNKLSKIFSFNEIKYNKNMGKQCKEKYKER